MTSTLTDQYVAAVARHASEKHRHDVERELRATIADNIDTRVTRGAAPDRAEYAALTELGAPEVLSTRYVDRARVLIGPQTYPGYRRALGLLCVTALPIVYIGQDIGYWVRGEGVGAVIFGPLSVTLTVAMYLIVCVTGLYLLVDRVHRPRHDRTLEWTPDELGSPTGDSRQDSRAQDDA
ncbi:hypothetical protein ACQPW1_18060 [Nocardia sp. CA-128927]|uniref:hypothetical protein n=1 Tax=Nocardia sp. CA-128927 TaxID=3239975 RepID=UPI003D9751DD